MEPSDDEKVAAEWDLMEYMDPMDPADMKKTKESTLKSLAVAIRAQGADQDKSKSLLKEKARDHRPFKCEANFFTFKIIQVNLSKEELMAKNMKAYAQADAE